ncbi:MAG: thiosulfate oxidation carrier protein SoxY [Azospirillum sp.]|nr:thiosulfate oxidation carrier protein SoxY [Azospirillum sp.]MCA3267569.1 thiosulfate oxidation carrier protein SoxY [Azospirillum sp.]
MKTVDNTRRRVVQTGGALAAFAAAGLLPTDALAAWNQAAFEGKNIPDTLKALNLDNPTPSGDLQIVASDIAENGAVVPIQIVSRIPNTTRIALMVEKNPNMLAAVFDVPEGMLPDVATRIRMQQTSNIVAVAVAGGKVHTVTREIKVTLGGCGG